MALRVKRGGAGRAGPCVRGGAGRPAPPALRIAPARASPGSVGAGLAKRQIPDARNARRVIAIGGLARADLSSQGRIVAADAPRTPRPTALRRSGGGDQDR
ncbi:MAG: hypothetical protein CML46_06820 [Rhodobacteraceae bacterium]|nr:hypothetical protein [Paracoccaceae bacterium]MBR26638.1 hypothetical protein [Paracoccaceae bacterium]